MLEEKHEEEEENQKRLKLLHEQQEIRRKAEELKAMRELEEEQRRKKAERLEKAGTLFNTVLNFTKVLGGGMGVESVLESETQPIRNFLDALAGSVDGMSVGELKDILRDFARKEAAMPKRTDNSNSANTDFIDLCNDDDFKYPSRRYYISMLIYACFCVCVCVCVCVLNVTVHMKHNVCI